jgi:hypothetical protein
MIVFERLIAVYYYFFLEIRFFFKRRKLMFLVGRDEDFRAVCLLSFAELLTSGLLLGILIRKSIINVESSFALTFIGVISVVLFSQYYYFIKNRERRRAILDQYSKLNSGQKFFWKLLAVVLIVGPIILFPVLFSKHN